MDLPEKCSPPLLLTMRQENAWRHRNISQHSLNPENPRASNTDDVECFFSIMRDHIGANFTLKQGQFGWQKVCLEFQKRIDADLPFYYFTSAHDCFYEGVCPSFNEPSKKKNQETTTTPRRASSTTFQWKSNVTCSRDTHNQVTVSQTSCKCPPTFNNASSHLRTFLLLTSSCIYI